MIFLESRTSRPKPAPRRLRPSRKFMSMLSRPRRSLRRPRATADGHLRNVRLGTGPTHSGLTRKVHRGPQPSPEHGLLEPSGNARKDLRRVDWSVVEASPTRSRIPRVSPLIAHRGSEGSLRSRWHRLEMPGYAHSDASIVADLHGLPRGRRHRLPASQPRRKGPATSSSACSGAPIAGRSAEENRF